MMTYACPSWFPSITKYDMDRLESIQRLCLKMVFPDLDHYCDRLAAANITTLQCYMSELCSSYSAKVIPTPSHRLAHLVPARQSANKHSTRTADKLIKSHRTQSLNNTLFYKFGV